MKFRTIIEGTLALTIGGILANESGFDSSRVNGISMMPAAYDENQYFSWNPPFLQYDRGDIIIFEKEGKKMMKRISNVQGDRIKSCEEEYCHVLGDCYFEEVCINRTLCPYNCEYREFTLGRDEFFVLGDNMPISKDSRDFGSIKRGDIKGKVIYIFRELKKD